MSRKYHVRKNRAPSNYPKRLAERELTHSPVMTDIETLRKWASQLPGKERERRNQIAQRQLSRPIRWEVGELTVVER